jgi:hypothetical protein
VKRALFASILIAGMAGGAYAGPLRANLLTSEPRQHMRPSWAFTIVQDSQFDPDPVHHSGIVTRTDIAPNASVGLGVLRSAPKRPSGEWKVQNGAPRPRKGLVSFLLRF